MPASVLVLDPFHAGSHAAFSAGWRGHSRHEIGLMTLPGRTWKWRMRGAAVTFAGRLHEIPPGGRPDVLVTTDMLDLATLRGLGPAWARTTPAAVYFHENQLTHPAGPAAGDHDKRRDEHFGFTNLTATLAADAVWFNSAFHRDDFLAAADALCRRLPDHPPDRAAARIAAKALVLPPGVGVPDDIGLRAAGPPRVAWVGRWEHDKRPEVFFAALDLLIERGVAFEVAVLGERYRHAPAVFERARERLGDRVRRWGYAEDRAEYEAELARADMVVSTAGHEFFGVAVAEAAARGAVPVVPRALAYPGVWGDAAVYHDNTPGGTADTLADLLPLVDSPPWAAKRAAAHRRATRYRWEVAAENLDAAVDTLAGPDGHH